MESEKASVVLSKDNLLLHFFEAVDSLYPPAPGEGFEATTLRLLEVKKRITQSDPPPVECVELIGSSKNVRQTCLLLSRLSAVFWSSPSQYI